MAEIKERTVLVVDDESDIRELVRYNLEMRGYRVEEAADGEIALEMAKMLQPAIIILDLMLPKIGGLEVCRILKTDSATKGIPIIMLTALGSEVDKIVGLELGADDYVTKPFSPRELVARIGAVLRRFNREETKGKMIRGELVIDQEQREARLKGEKLDLTLKEYELLELLAAHPNRVFSREQLLDRLWGYDFVGDTRTVDVHICNLRRKLGGEDGDSDVQIETVRGVGYRLLLGR